MKVGIGILSYNRPESLDKCLLSLVENLDRPVKIAVSFDQWDSSFKEIAGHYPIWGLSGTRKGIPFANNRLMKFFDGFDAVFLVQDDMRFLRPEWLECYLKGLRAAPYLAFFDPFYAQDANRAQHYRVNYLGRRQFETKDGIKLWRCRKSPQGAFQAIGRACIDAVGYFDPQFGTYGLEHHDYWLRTCNAGLCPRECFYDVPESAALIKIDWSVPPSLNEEERNKAYQQSKSNRDALYGPGGNGFCRVKVDDPAVDYEAVHNGPQYHNTPFAARTADDILSRDFWVYDTRLPILSYHAVADAPQDRYAVSPQRFDSQMKILSGFFRFVTASQALDIWMKEGCFPQDLAVLTFDDGYEDIMSILPCLEELGIPCTVFMPADYVGNDNSWDNGAFTHRRHLNWNELSDLVSRGHEVGSHALSHRRLTFLKEDEAFREIAESQQRLSDHLKRPVRSIAYPFGSVDKGTENSISQVYDVGFVSGQGGVLDWDENLFLIRRIPVYSGDDNYGLLERIAGYMMEAPVSEPVWRPIPQDNG